ncbi:MAG: MBOAT family protein [Allomuricauda sp.]
MSYSIDIYRKQFSPTKDFIAFATFVSFFPQLVAGPIERASNLLPQIAGVRKWNHQYFKEGIFQITVGFFRKVVIADSIGSYIDVIYNAPDLYNSSTILIAVILYSFQIYFDFSGYSDIAIGTAKLLGFRFMQNFNLPYFSSSITEFWRRWHISLSSWLRDYLYIPLGGNRKGILKQYRNLFLTMLLGGLWHGSSWNFVIWGAAHGTLLAVEKKFDLIPKTYKWFKNAIVFLAVSLIWILFRSLNFGDSSIIFSKIFSLNYDTPFLGDISIFTTIVYGLLIGLSIDFYLFRQKKVLETMGGHLKNPIYVLIITFLLLNIILFYSSAINFIYFQFYIL